MFTIDRSADLNLLDKDNNVGDINYHNNTQDKERDNAEYDDDVEWVRRQDSDEDDEDSDNGDDDDDDEVEEEPDSNKDGSQGIGANDLKDFSFFERDLAKSAPVKSKSLKTFDPEATYMTSIKDRRKCALTNVDELLKKSIIKPGFENLHAIPMPESKRIQKKQRQEARDLTKGKNWYHLPATKVTEDIKNDLEILKMRSVLDPKHVYKKNDITVTPKYFQVGKVVETAADFYSGRIPKSQRKRTIVDELLADSQCKAYHKKKFKEIVDDSHRKRRKNFAKSKELKSKKKDKNKKKK